MTDLPVLTSLKLENNYIRDIAQVGVAPSPIQLTITNNCLQGDRLEPSPLLWITSHATDTWSTMQSSGCPATVCEGALDVPQAECKALVSIYDNTGSTSWTNHLGWNAYYHIGHWYGVELTGNNVTKVSLPLNNLTSDFGFTTGNLNALETLELYDNALTSFSSSGFASLKALDIANNALTTLTSNGFSGALTYLNLFENFITNDELSATSSIVTDVSNMTSLDPLSTNCLVNDATLAMPLITWLDAHHLGTPKNWTLTNTGTK